MALNPIDPSLDDYRGQWALFDAVLSDVTVLLDGLPPETVWPIDATSGGNIGQVSLADFRFKFANIDWTLTDKSYTDLNGGVGEVASVIGADGVWQGAHEEIRAEDFAQYMAWPDREGAVYLALHETAHVTELGLTMNKAMYDMYRHHGGDPRYYANSREWVYNEAVANRIAAAVGAAIGLAELPEPPEGFPDTIIRHNRFV
jgi:hypothetical protein